MNLWLEAIGAILFACAGILIGRFFSRLPKPYWTIGFFIPFALVLAYGAASHFPALLFTPPLSWMMTGQKKFAVLGFITAVVLTTPLSRLPQKRDRTAVFAFMLVVVFVVSVLPYVAFAFNRNELDHLKTHIGADGVCFQSTEYTCGPATAVTALHKLGLPAEEGKIAILSGTSFASGTPPDILADALQNEYAKSGLIVEYRTFKDISELKKAGLTLAITKFGFLVDHYVVVLDVTDSEVVVANPLTGLERMSHDEFNKIWRFTGIVLSRKL